MNCIVEVLSIVQTENVDELSKSCRLMLNIAARRKELAFLPGLLVKYKKWGVEKYKKGGGFILIPMGRFFDLKSKQCTSTRPVKLFDV